MKLNSCRGIGSDGDGLLTPYVPEGITGYDDDDDETTGIAHDEKTGCTALQS